ncbi:hypothetical protein PanWU01x14_315900 [Parasponia andersonii]|uniref:Uncharacterized protein n=1 Tax=Parasponia andersonii TaxID=3476 RepID=A0A2P5AN84_PARAD|nr:hypothetical protein PanWU01x14_315900 [Parasponia andersonii]
MDLTKRLCELSVLCYIYVTFLTSSPVAPVYVRQWKQVSVLLFFRNYLTWVKQLKLIIECILFSDVRRLERGCKRRCNVSSSYNVDHLCILFSDVRRLERGCKRRCNVSSSYNVDHLV